MDNGHLTGDRERIPSGERRVAIHELLQNPRRRIAHEKLEHIVRVRFRYLLLVARLSHYRCFGCCCCCCCCRCGRRRFRLRSRPFTPRLRSIGAWNFCCCCCCCRTAQFNRLRRGLATLIVCPVVLFIRRLIVHARFIQEHEHERQVVRHVVLVPRLVRLLSIQIRRYCVRHQNRLESRRNSRICRRCCCCCCCTAFPLNRLFIFAPIK